MLWDRETCRPALLAIAVGAFFWFEGHQIVSLDTLKANRDRLLTYTQDHYALAVLVFIAGYCVQAAVFLPGDALLTLLGGFLFGSVLGTLYVNVGATAGATLAFLAARYFFREWVEGKFGSRLTRLQQGFSEHAFTYLLGLRLIPVMPFFLVNLLSGLTRVRVLPYVLATSLGMAPASFVYAYAGRELGSIDSLDEITSPSVLIAFGLLSLLILLPTAYRQWRADKQVV